MRLLRHVLPARLRPVVRVAGRTALWLVVGTLSAWCVWTLTAALAEHDAAEHRERFFREVRHNLRTDQLIEAACSAEHLLAPSQRPQLRELCVRLGPGAMVPH